MRTETLGWDLLRFVPALVFFAGAGLFYNRRRLLRRRGLTVTGRCVDRRWQGQGGPSYVLHYVAQDGRQRVIIAGAKEVPPGTREGSEVIVCYDPKSPERAEPWQVTHAPLWRRGYELILMGMGVGAVVYAVFA
ncbi:DUF3592 domain-containing protein [Streptomyces sp. NPDC046939]|uniref:DUF3592 domain-containing protein n=1 Tax=Streptomyces sp. NPDC046939 TaxID=3155376 RepID=UPI0033CAAA6C